MLGWADAQTARRLGQDERFVATWEVTPESQRAVLWNHRLPGLDDARVRRALTRAVDREELAEVLGFPPDPRIGDYPYSRRLLGAGLVPAALGYDREAAAAALTEAGWIDRDGDGVRERGDQRLSFRLMSPQETSDAAVYLQAALREVGVNLELAVVDLNTVRRSWRR